MITADIARQHLTEWQNSLPQNFFSADLNFQRSLELLWGTADYKQNMARLYKFGGLAAAVLDAAATRLASHPPTLHRHNALGQAHNEVEFHPDHHLLARHLSSAGLTAVQGEPGHNLLGAALYYLSSQLGETGHHSPIATTIAVIKLLQHAAAPAIRDQFLPALLDDQRDPPFTAAHFLAEIQGDADLGSNTTFAYADEPDVWAISGEKWFCANLSADLILVTAQVAGQGDGAEGLGLFLVPRHLPDGINNGLTIHRLKDTLGTRSLATGEVTFDNALAYPVGPTEQGYVNLMGYGLNTIWLHQALACAAHARRAYVTAWKYAEHRHAFGAPLLHSLLGQDSLTQMRSDAAALLSGSLRLAKLRDELETGEAKEGTEAILSLGITLNHLRATGLTRDLIHQGLEILGSNGLVEDFSVLPRLLRDTIVYENGINPAHALVVLAQQKMVQDRAHEPLIRLIRAMLQPSPFDELRREALAQLSQVEQQLTDLLAMDALSATVPLRPLCLRLMDLFYTACLAVEGAWEYLRKDDRSKQRLVEFFFVRRVVGREAKDIPDYAHQISKLCKDIHPSRIDWQKDEELRQQLGDWAE